MLRLALTIRIIPEKEVGVSSEREHMLPEKRGCSMVFQHEGERVLALNRDGVAHVY